ncbi:MAG: hypothetical protein H6709_03260 [Kofleriaceae bacterium]|nr:hypothetical protein [Myxococcales bacterium]MCB9562768.1 hypothetical protein [Kofleriaceae bacterium]MCB9571087.1 hypothetical protein [Kofleriaceae bacterium]
MRARLVVVASWIAAGLGLGATAVTAAGCEGEASFGDPFPIVVDLGSGAVIAHVREGDGTVRTATVDVLAPLTVIDVAPGTAVSRRSTTLTLLGGTGTELVPRAHLPVTVTQLHACPQEPCQVGPEAAPVAIDAVIGGDALDTGAARFDLTTSELFLFPDVAGDDAARGRVCDAVMSRPFHGGGTLYLDGTKITFAAHRIAIGACLAYDPEEDPDLATEAGADVQLVLSTGMAPTILSWSAYRRWLDATGLPEPTGLPRGAVWLPGGLVEGTLATIDRMALVGDDTTLRGPCRKVRAHHLLSVRDCQTGDSCPCSGGATFCQVPAVVELSPAAGIEVLLVDDDDPVLQALRSELRPEAAEVDGILGTDAMRALAFDVDAPNSRVLMRCESFGGCVARPQLRTSTSRCEIGACLARAGHDDVCGVVPTAADAAMPDAEAPDAGGPDAGAPDAAAAAP